MSVRTYLLGVAAGVLGTAVVVMPALAGTETPPSVEAVNYGLYYHYWRPATATVLPGGAVKFSNPYATTNHGLEFTSTTKPTCAGIPKAATEVTGAASWAGECTFASAGTYTFVCTVHPGEMKGTITVSSSGTTTVTTTTTTSTGTPPPPGETPPNPTPGGGSPQQAAGASSPLAGAASAAVRLGTGAHGRFIRGSVNISPAGAGGRLEVDLMAARGSLARAGRTALVQLGRLVRQPVAAGIDPFKLSLSPRALRALHAQGHLHVSVKVVLTPLRGSPVTVTRSLLLRS
jgi:plastocyanin